MVRLLAESFDNRFCVVRGDIERAFPSTSPFDISSMLLSLGVPPPFVNILNQLYLNVESVGVVNGKPGGSAKCRWKVQGLRQGCPASPLLMAIWVQNAIQQIKGKGFQCVSFADDIWIVCPPQSQQEAKRCMQSPFAGAGLTINPLKVKIWSPSSPEPLEILGMILFQGRGTSISESVLQKVRNLLSGGREREFSCFKRVLYVNTVCLPALRYKMSAARFSHSKDVIGNADRMLRNFVRGKDWPSNTPTDFLTDTHVGLSLLTLRTESVRDLLSFVWSLSQGRESAALRARFLQAWKERAARPCHPLSLLDDWDNSVTAIDGKSFFDWNDEERELPQALHSDSVFPFGAKGSYLCNVLQKWPEQQMPPPPRCRNDACFRNPCPVLERARGNSDPVIWATEAGKIGSRSRKGLFAAILDGCGETHLLVSRISVPVLETGCIQILRNFFPRSLSSLSPPISWSFPLPLSLHLAPRLPLPLPPLCNSPLTPLFPPPPPLLLPHPMLCHVSCTPLTKPTVDLSSFALAKRKSFIPHFREKSRGSNEILGSPSCLIR